MNKTAILTFFLISIIVIVLMLIKVRKLNSQLNQIVEQGSEIDE